MAMAAPVSAGHTVATGLTDDLVIVEGYDPNGGPLHVEVLRGGLRIATAGPFTPPTPPPGQAGAVEINHLGSPACWKGFTPDVAFGDIVRVTQGGLVEESSVRNVAITATNEPDDTTFEIHGTAQDAQGNQLPVGELEVRLINPGFQGFFGGGPFVLAPGTKISGDATTVIGSIAYDQPGVPGNPAWTATFTFTGDRAAAAQNVAAVADPEASWATATLTEVTEVGLGGLGGPVVDCTASPGAPYVVTKTTPNVITATTDLSVEGAARDDATTVQVTLTDANGLNIVSSPGVLQTPPGSGGKIWSATIPAAMIASLADGVLTATPHFNGGSIPGLARTLLKSPGGQVTAFTSAPPSATTAHVATLAVSSNDPNATFECSIDARPFGACGPQTILTQLALGAHSYSVRTRDVDGTLYPSTVTHAWTVVTPETTLTGPTSGTANSGTFTFTSPNDASATFQCSLDGVAFAACTSPVTLTGLSIGNHTFRVRAVDASLTVDPTPAQHEWAVTPDTQRPIVTGTVGPLAKITMGRNGKLLIKAKCNERCTIVAKATVNVPSPLRSGKRKLYAITSKTISSGANVTSQVRLTLSARQLLAVRNSLKAGRRVKITITVIGTDLSGNTSNALRTLTLNKKSF